MIGGECFIIKFNCIMVSFWDSAISNQIYRPTLVLTQRSPATISKFQQINLCIFHFMTRQLHTLTTDIKFFEF